MRTWVLGLVVVAIVGSGCLSQLGKDAERAAGVEKFRPEHPECEHYEVDLDEGLAAPHAAALDAKVEGMSLHNVETAATVPSLTIAPSLEVHEILVPPEGGMPTQTRRAESPEPAVLAAWGVSGKAVGADGTVVDFANELLVATSPGDIAAAGAGTLTSPDTWRIDGPALTLWQGPVLLYYDAETKLPRAPPVTGPRSATASWGGSEDLVLPGVSWLVAGKHGNGTVTITSRDFDLLASRVVAEPTGVAFLGVAGEMTARLHSYASGGPLGTMTVWGHDEPPVLRGKAQATGSPYTFHWREMSGSYEPTGRLAVEGTAVQLEKGNRPLAEARLSATHPDFDPATGRVHLEVPKGGTFTTVVEVAETSGVGTAMEVLPGIGAQPDPLYVAWEDHWEDRREVTRSIVEDLVEGFASIWVEIPGSVNIAPGAKAYLPVEVRTPADAEGEFRFTLTFKGSNAPAVPLNLTVVPTEGAAAGDVPVETPGPGLWAVLAALAPVAGAAGRARGRRRG